MQLLIIDAMNLIRRIYAAAEESELALDATRLVFVVCPRL